MANLADIEKLISLFGSYLCIDTLQLVASDWYSLFPAPYDKEKAKKRQQWPGTYPGSENQGVYCIFDNNKNLLYIGKASMNSCIGNRLGSYFSFEKDKKTCKVNHNWSSKPEYIVTFSVPTEFSFIAPALEEYLIKNLAESLPDNKVGTN